MDGVLADFDQALLNKGIVNKINFIHRQKSEWTESEIKLDEQVKSVMAESGFWLGIPIMSGALKLWGFCNSVDETFILTARPRESLASDAVVEEKWIWLTEVFGSINPRKYICCLRHEKKDYVDNTHKSMSVLIDDMQSNCDDWTKSGGHAILHTSVSSTLKHLEKIYN